jgi:hypothetical protein
MPAPIIAAIIAAIPAIVQGISAMSQRRKYADAVSGIKYDKPEALTAAESILTKNASQGLPGYEKMQGDILGSMPQTLENLKEVANNPASILGGLNDAQSTVTNSLSNLAVKDAMQKLANNEQLATFLSTVKTGFETDQQKYMNDVKLSALREKMQGSADMMSGINSGVASGISAYGNFSALEYQKNRYNAWDDFIQNGSKTFGSKNNYTPMVSMPNLPAKQVQWNNSTPFNLSPDNDFLQPRKKTLMDYFNNFGGGTV